MAVGDRESPEGMRDHVPVVSERRIDIGERLQAVHRPRDAEVPRREKHRGDVEIATRYSRPIEWRSLFRQCSRTVFSASPSEAQQTDQAKCQNSNQRSPQKPSKPVAPSPERADIRKLLTTARAAGE
jgi:hypothetical protein